MKRWNSHKQLLQTNCRYNLVELTLYNTFIQIDLTNVTIVLRNLWTVFSFSEGVSIMKGYVCLINFNIDFFLDRRYKGVHESFNIK